jgi:ParB family chromosome partitioning protein
MCCTPRSAAREPPESLTVAARVLVDNPAMVTKKPKGLGMGLEALLGPKVSDAPAAAAGLPTELALDRLRAGKYQPRTRMDEGSLYELAESIRSQGVMQPILVRPVGAGHYEIIAGERRYRAARLAGLASVPVLVKDVADEAAAVMALIENIQREDLNPLEEAQGLQRLVSEFKLTHEQAAQAVGRSRSAASNLLRLLNLADPVQQMLMAGDLDMGHARALLALPAAQQVMAAHQISARKLSVREAERLVARAAQSGKPASAGDKIQAARHPAAGRAPGRRADRGGGHPHQAPHTPRRRRRDRDRLRVAGRTERPAGKARLSDS